MIASDRHSAIQEALIQQPLGKTSCLEISVVMPCLNEADTLEACIEKAQRALSEHNIQGEVVVADNGSTDGSQAIAAHMGVHVVHVEAKAMAMP